MTQHIRETNTLSGLVSLWEIMESFNASQFLDLMKHLPLVFGGDNEILNEETRANIRETSEGWSEVFIRLGLLASLATMDKIRKLMDEPRATLAEAHQLNQELQERLIDEAKFRMFFVLSLREGQLYRQTQPFGDLVAEKFPGVQFDIEEAAKCLTFDRGTACVFHLMRTLELAMHVLLTDMGEPYDPATDTDWSKILAKCNQHIASAGAKQQFYRDAVTMLTTVKWSWRNPTMHPRATYTQEEAQSIWDSVRVFMRYLGTELSESVIEVESV